MTHAVVRGAPTTAQLYLEDIITELVRETGRAEDRHSLNRILFKCLRDNPDRLCIIDGRTDERATNGEVVVRAVQTARALTAHGLRVGDVAVAMAQNHMDYTALYYGAIFAGVTLFNFETILTSREVQHYVKLTKTAIVFTDADKADLMMRALKQVPESPDYVIFGDKDAEESVTFAEFIQGHSDSLDGYWPVSVDKSAVCLLFTTGGSTGQGPPKVAPITNAGLVAQAPIEWTYEEDFPRNSELMLMIFHGQWTVHTKLFITAVIYGATILVQSQDFNISNVIDLIRKYRPTWSIMVPPEVNNIINSSQYRRGDLHSFKTFAFIGCAPKKELVARLKHELIPTTLLSNRLGMTEAHGYVCLGDRHDPPALGIPVNIFLYKLIDKDGKAVMLNQPGELCLKSNDCLIKTYYGDDEAVRAMYTPDGWFRTGDLMCEDDKGAMHYLCRLKFTVFNMGYPFSPLEVEEVVCAVPGVTQAVVVGRSDVGPAALVVPAHGAAPSRDDIKAAVKDKLNFYKHLSAVGFVNSLPCTAVGKLHRRQCAAIVEEMICNNQCY